MHLSIYQKYIVWKDFIIYMQPLNFDLHQKVSSQSTPYYAFIVPIDCKKDNLKSYSGLEVCLRAQNILKAVYNISYIFNL